METGKHWLSFVSFPSFTLWTATPEAKELTPHTHHTSHQLPVPAALGSRVDQVDVKCFPKTRKGWQTCSFSECLWTEWAWWPETDTEILLSLLFSSKEGKKKKVKVLTRNKFSYFWVQMVPQKKPPSNLPTSIGAESRTQNKLTTSTPEVVQETQWGASESKAF